MSGKNSIQSRRSAFKGYLTTVAAAVLGLILVLSACGENPTAAPTATPVPPTPTPSPTPTPNAKSIAKDSAEKLLAVNSLHFVVDIKQGVVNLYQNITLKKADGDFLRPDKFQAKLRIGFGPGLADAETIGVGNDEWLQSKPLISQWLQLPSEVGFKPDVLFDKDKGLGATAQKLNDLKLVGTETVDGVESWHLSGTVPGPDIAPLTAGTLGKNDVILEMWIGKADGLIREVTFKETGSADPKTASLWEIHFSKFNNPVTINKPV